eukprot:TRINITY_DN5095_c0_g1_i4.p1 TRINITY_DN5095_c0_g1~~TRINITY_DN5095_c0_g1_i4.p1  ORF type:complete len:987 (+),score=207.27 TRINITY_DN5095_c0_g1_i4:68-3028(+)
MQFVPCIEGHLEIKGTLSQNANAKKFEKYLFRLQDGVLMYYNPNHVRDEKSDLHLKEEQDGLIDIVPLTNMVVEDVSKKDKPATGHAFVLSSEKRKFRTIFCTEKEEELIEWKQNLHLAIQLAHPEFFKTSLSDACLKSNKSIPLVVELSIAQIDQNLQVEGLFRVPGDKTGIAAAQETWDKGLIPDVSNSEPHLVCGLLKSYLRELSEPIVPPSLFRTFLQTQSLDDLKKNVSLLPHFNQTTLCYLIHFLKRVEKESKYNLMDASNLATVFGPTIIRNTQDDGQSGKASDLEDMAISNQIIKILLHHCDTVFPLEKYEQCLKPIFDASTSMKKKRLVMTTAERVAIESVIVPHHEYVRNDGSKITIGPNLRDSMVWDKTIHFLVNMKTSSKGKNETFEPRIFVADQNRIFLFHRGGKPEYDFHLLDLIDVESPSRNEISLTWGSALSSPEKKPITVTLHPISYHLFDTDTIIEWLNRQWENNFIGVPSADKFRFKIGPSSRKDMINSRFQAEDIDKEIGCSGLVRTYISVCDWMNQPVQDEVIWDLENYFYPNNLKVFNIYDIIHKDKFPCPEYQTIIYSLKYNQWFTELDCSKCSMPNEAMTLLGDMFETNSTISSLVLKDTGISSKGISALCDSLKKNPSNSLRQLNISGSSIDSKKVLDDFAQTLKMHLGKLRALDVSNSKLVKVSPFLEGIAGAPSLMDNLKELNLSLNKFDSEASTKLGNVLSMTRALTSLCLSGTLPVWQSVCDGMFEPRKNLTVKILDLSHNPTKAKNQKGITQLISYLPNLTTLNLADTGITAETVSDILHNNVNITDLDISENDLTDEGIITVSRAIRETSSKLAKVRMSSVFKTKTKLRAEAMKSVALALNTKSSIKEFYLNKNKLKSDMNDFLTRLLNNQSLQLLDISANSGGDDVIGIIAKVLQHNHTIHSLFWDENDTTLIGLKKIKLGLQRNDAIRYMPLPLLDISTIMKTSEPDAIHENF